MALEMEFAQGAIRVHCDSQSAPYLVQNSIHHARAKHIDIKYHRIRELMEEHEVELVKVHTKKNQTDTLTKTLPRDNFLKYVALMGLMDQTEFVKALGHQDGDYKLRYGAFKP